MLYIYIYILVVHSDIDIYFCHIPLSRLKYNLKKIQCIWYNQTVLPLLLCYDQMKTTQVISPLNNTSDIDEIKQFMKKRGKFGWWIFYSHCLTFLVNYLKFQFFLNKQAILPVWQWKNEWFKEYIMYVTCFSSVERELG